MSTAGTCQPSVASAQCLPLAAPMQPLVAVDGGGWHPVVSCPATWVPHWGWGGVQAPGTHPALSTQMSSPACQLLFPLPILSHLPALHCTISTAFSKRNQALPGGCRAGKKAWDQFLLPPPILPPRSSYLPPPTPFLLEVHPCLSFGTSLYGLGTLIPVLFLKCCDLSLDRPHSLSAQQEPPRLTFK